MKILHIIYDDPDNPWLGGGGAIRTRVINEILAKDHRITVICGRYKNAPRREVVNGVKYVRIGSSLNYLTSRLTYSFLAWVYILKIEHDVLIEDFSGFSLTFSPLFTSKPAIGVIQNHFGPNFFRKSGVLGIIPYVYERYCIRLFDKYITVSNAIVAEWLSEKRRNDVVFIPQGIHIDGISKISRNEKYVLFVGRLDFVQKGIDILIKSMAMIRDLSVPLIMVGGGDEARLSDMIKRAGLNDLIEFVGKVPHDKLSAYYQNAYFLCMPSRYEGWPLVCLESYIHGKPVVGTAIAGLQDVVEHGGTGLLVPPENPELFAGGMRTLIEDPILRHRLGEAAFQKAHDYSWTKMASKQNQWYLDAVKK